MIYCFLLSGVVKAVHTPTKARIKAIVQYCSAREGFMKLLTLHYLGLGFCLR